jgi:hypothetical protein
MKTRFALLGLATVLGCASPAASVDGGAVDDIANNGMWAAIPGGACGARERNVAVQASPHVDVDAGAIAYLTNPPASGPHYPVWAHWGVWPDLPRGYWVHNLEHGGVVFLYRCASGSCDATRDALATAARSIPADPVCAFGDASPVGARVVVTSDREITTEVAGAAWGWLYAADCVDAPSMRSFYARHAVMSPEDLCADGVWP